MKPSISFGIKTAIIIGVSVGLALAFNATRSDRLPLIPDPQIAAEIAVQRGEIPLTEAITLFHSGQAVFVDAREAEEYALGHIEGALALDPMSFGQNFPAVRARLEGMTVITYCDGEFCELSHELAEQLKSMGLQDVRVLKNGWSLWRDQGLPIATGGQTEPLDTPLETAVEELEADEAETNASTPAAPETMEPALAIEPILPELPENAPEEAEPNGTIDPGQMGLPQELAPPDQPSLDPATPQPDPAEQAPADAAPAEQAPIQPEPQEMPVPEPHQDDHPPATETQGEQS
jgi:rhodanese-related sulfurtransferase